MKNFALLAGVLLLATAATGCPGSVPSMMQPSRFLELSDVTNLPAGDAVGSGFNGRLYVQSSFLIESCECSRDSVSFENPCESFELQDDTGFVIEILQDGGSIQFRILVQDPVTGELVDLPLDERRGFSTGPGTMNLDGSFAIGGVGDITDLVTGQVIGRVLVLIEGQFVGDVMSLTITERATARKGDLLNDCSFRNLETMVRIE